MSSSSCDPLDLLFPPWKDDGTLEGAARLLEHALSSGYAIMDDGTVCGGKVRVDKVKGLRIVIHPKEHPPPHFHVIWADSNVSFHIDTCKPLDGHNVRRREKKIIQTWYHRRGGKERVRETWNTTRPG